MLSESIQLLSILFGSAKKYFLFHIYNISRIPVVEKRERLIYNMIRIIAIFILEPFGVVKLDQGPRALRVFRDISKRGRTLHVIRRLGFFSVINSALPFKMALCLMMGWAKCHAMQLQSSLITQKYKIVKITGSFYIFYFYFFAFTPKTNNLWLGN